MVTRLDSLAKRFPDLDALGLLGERAACSDLRRHGHISCGGTARLLAAADGWIVLSLPRPEDHAAVAAWLERDDLATVDQVEWSALAAEVRERPTAQLEERAVLLQLPVAPVGRPLERDPVMGTCLGNASPGHPDGLLVVDLSSLWAGPLCADLLRSRGALVVKVESTSRPDGARTGAPAFFDLLNAGKRSVALDVATDDGVAVLHDLLSRADVVVESSRPRALEHWGIVAADLVAEGGPRIWVSITGYGRAPGWRDRVAFGDDAAAAGGLIVRDSEGAAYFCGDAIADPLSGLTAAAACLDALDQGGRWLLDVAMVAVASHFAGPTIPLVDGVSISAPAARHPARHAVALGSDNTWATDLLASSL